MTRALLTILCLIGAVILYFLGAIYAAMALFIVGGLLELVFWILFLGRRSKRDTELHH